MARANQPAGAPMMSLITRSRRLAGSARLAVEHLHARVDKLLEGFGPADERRKRAEMHRNHCLYSEQLHRLGGTMRPHREEVADREEGYVELAQLRDEGHVAEHIRVAGEIDSEAVFELDHKSECLSAVDDLVAVRNATAVLGVDEGDLDAVHVDGSPQVGAGDGVPGNSFRAEPRADLVGGSDLGLGR